MAGTETAGKEKILLVRAGRGGDLIMITPAVRALLAAYPGAEFHLLTTGDGRRILGDFDPRLTRTFLYTRRFPRTLLRQRQLTRQLRNESYTRIYIFETKPHYRRWLGKLAPEVHVLNGTAADGHYCARCLDLVAANVEEPIVRGWTHLAVDEDGRRKARRLLTDCGVDPEAVLVGLHPTFSGTGLPLFRDRDGLKHRMWPAESFAHLGRLLGKESGGTGRPLAVVIDALPDEVPYVRSIADQSEGAITLLAAPPDFQRYKGFLSLLDVLVTPNTGPMHMAAALGTRLVALFSRWAPEDCGPYMNPRQYLVVRAEDTDRPELGLAAISPATVAGAVEKLIQLG